MFNKIIDLAKYIRRNKLENKEWIYVDNEFNVNLINILPNQYYFKNDILIVDNPYGYLKEINNREPAKHELDQFIYIDKISFINRKHAKGYIDINTFNHVIDSYRNLNSYLKSIIYADKKLCEEMTTNKICLGKGITGMVCKLNNVNDVVVKEVDISKKDLTVFTNGVIITNKKIHEVLIAAKFSQIYFGINGSFNKNFLYYDGFFVCEHKLYLVMEKADGILQDLFTKTITLKIVKSLLFQLLFAVKTMQYFYKAVHNDLHDRNVFINKVNIKEKYLRYKFKNDVWYIDNVGYIVKIGDLDVVSIFEKPSIIREDIYNDELEGIYNVFLPGYDTLYIILIFIFFSQSYLYGNNEKYMIESFYAKLLKQIYDITNVKTNDFIKEFGSEELRPLIKYAKYDYSRLLLLFGENRTDDYFEIANII